MGKYKKLVSKDEKAQRDLLQPEARYKLRVSNRIQFEQALQESKFKLATSMGLEFDKYSLLGDPEDAFPEIKKIPSRIFNPESLKIVLKQRQDYSQQIELMSFAEIQLDQAKTLLLPDLKLNANFGYKGFDSGGKAENYFSSFSNHVRGLNYSGSLTLSFPLGNTISQK